MSDRTDNEERTEMTPEEARQGERGPDVLAILAISTFMAAIALVTFFLTTALG